MEPAIVVSLVRRYLKMTSGIVFATNDNTAPVSVELEDGELLIAWYKNPPPWDSLFVIFSTSAIYVCAEVITRMRLDDIIEYELPKSKSDASGVRVRTRDGFCFIRMAGTYGPGGRFTDAFALVGFLHVICR